VNLQGKLKSNKKLASELSFDFCVDSVGERFTSALIQLWVVCLMGVCKLIYVCVSVSVSPGQCSGLLETWDARKEL